MQLMPVKHLHVLAGLESIPVRPIFAHSYQIMGDQTNTVMTLTDTSAFLQAGKIKNKNLLSFLRAHGT